MISCTIAPGYVSNPIAVFMRLDCGTNDCSDEGDSGGPVYRGSGFAYASAVGIISGAIDPVGDQDVIYMAANDISGVGASVLA